MTVCMCCFVLELVLEVFFGEFKPFVLKCSEMRSLKKEPDNSATFF